ncbi:hypothetical protein, partial [Pseudomonas viridiflava]
RYTLSESGVFSDYNMEQQGEIVSDYYLICVRGNPRGVWNADNVGKNPDLLSATLRSLLDNPSDTANLPE